MCRSEYLTIYCLFLYLLTLLFFLYHKSTGFYRKDHLRKHTRSHIARRVKSEVSATTGANGQQSGTGNGVHGS